MPIYSFISKGGEVIEELVSSGTKRVTRDGVDYDRCIGSEGFIVSGQAKIPSQAEQVKGGYYDLERAEGSRFLKKSQFSTKQIKRAWGF